MVVGWRGGGARVIGETLYHKVGVIQQQQPAPQGLVYELDGLHTKQLYYRPTIDNSSEGAGDSYPIIYGFTFFSEAPASSREESHSQQS